LTGEVPGATPSAFWDSFHSTPGAVLTHAVAMGLGVFVVSRGVRGIETAAKVLIPSLVALLVVLAVRAVTLPGASAGLAFLFTPDWAALSDYRIWIEALTQNAWDTGAGWGLVVSYAVYMRAREDTALNAFVIGFGNNSMSLLAGIMVLCTVFSIMPEAADQIVGAGNEGLTFIWVPQLFQQIPAGRFFQAIFFLALVFAAWTSLVAMIELSSRVLLDLGMSRARAITVVGTAGFLFGVPSALRLGIFQNQDWVWGVGLMVSGFFFAFAVLRYGVTRWRETFINHEHSDVRIGAWWDWAMRLVALEAVVLALWWLWGARGEDFSSTWTLFSAYNVGSVLIQFGIALALVLALNRWLAASADSNSGE
jgi:NSS family neurotransmitter:Na+ symporter